MKNTKMNKNFYNVLIENNLMSLYEINTDEWIEEKYKILNYKLDVIDELHDIIDYHIFDLYDDLDENIDELDYRFNDLINELKYINDIIDTLIELRLEYGEIYNISCFDDIIPKSYNRQKLHFRTYDISIINDNTIITIYYDGLIVVYRDNEKIRSIIEIDTIENIEKYL